MKKFKSVEKLVNQLKPNDPVYCIRKHPIVNASKFFQKIFLKNTIQKQILTKKF